MHDLIHGHESELTKGYFWGSTGGFVAVLGLPLQKQMPTISKRGSPGLLDGIGRVYQESPVRVRDNDNQPGTLHSVIPHNRRVYEVWATNTV